MIIFHDKMLVVQACVLEASGDSSLQTITDGEPSTHLKALKQSQGLDSFVLDAGEVDSIYLICMIFRNFTNLYLRLNFDSASVPTARQGHFTP